METIAIKKQEQLFIDILLYEGGVNYSIKRKLWIKTLIWILIIDSILFFGLNITEIFLIISSTAMIIIGLFLYEYKHYLFTVSKESLIISYGEIFLLDSSKVKWNTTIDQCYFRQSKNKKNEFTRLTILDKKGFAITIQCIIPIDFFEKTNNKEPSDYYIHSKTDWNVLMEYLEIR